MITDGVAIIIRPLYSEPQLSIQWTFFIPCQVLLDNGILLTFTVAKHSGDIETVLIDRTLLAKLQAKADHGIMMLFVSSLSTPPKIVSLLLLSPIPPLSSLPSLSSSSTPPLPSPGGRWQHFTDSDKGQEASVCLPLSETLQWGTVGPDTHSNKLRQEVGETLHL